MKAGDLRKELRAKYPKEFLEVDMDLKFQVARLCENARIGAGLTQEKLAKKIGTNQPSIARLESGSTLPSFRFIQRVLKVCGGYIKIEFVPF